MLVTVLEAVEAIRAKGTVAYNVRNDWGHFKSDLISIVLLRGGCMNLQTGGGILSQHLADVICEESLG